MAAYDWWLWAIGIAVALSGWGKVLYDYVSSRPKIRGQVFQVIRGMFQIPGASDERLTSFMTYLYLVNLRKSSVHILDYQMEIKLGWWSWQPLRRVYGLHSVPSLHFDGANTEFSKKLQEKLIYRNNEPVQFGSPLEGWIMFGGDADLYDREIDEYRVICIDAFRRRHKIKTKPNDFISLDLLQEKADILVPAQWKR